MKRLALWGWGNSGPGWIGWAVESGLVIFRIVFPGTACGPGWFWCRIEFGEGVGPAGVLLLGLVGVVLRSLGAGRWLRPVDVLSLVTVWLGEFRLLLLFLSELLFVVSGLNCLKTMEASL